MNREELKEILPHREPMLLIDEAERQEDGTAIGRYKPCAVMNFSCRAISRGCRWCRA